MNAGSSTERPEEQGATGVITHRVRRDSHPEYERWLGEVQPVCKSMPGHLDSHIIRPVPGLTEMYMVVIRFDTTEHLKHWMDSTERAELIEKVNPLLASGDDFFISSGLDFWFTPAGAQARLPVRWKQFLLTWSAIYPLALAVPVVVPPALQVLGVPDYVLLTTLAVTGLIVFFMVYLVMPRYTRLMQRWLFD